MATCRVIDSSRLPGVEHEELAPLDVTLEEVDLTKLRALDEACL